MQIEYWVAASHDDPTYSLRAKTRAEVVAMLRAEDCGSTGKRLSGYQRGEQFYNPPRKVVVKYRDDWNLLMQALGGYIYET